MKKSIYLVSILLIALINNNCKKDDDLGFDHSKWNYIVAGDYSDALILNINDTLENPIYSKKKSTLIDIDSDSIPDMKFLSNFGSFLGQSKSSCSAEIKTYNNCEIIIDSTVKTIKRRTDYILDHKMIKSDTIFWDSLFVTPKALESGELINSNSNWHNIPSNLLFSFNRDKIIKMDSPEYIFENNTFQGWNNLNEKYLGFRIILEKDTLYGFVKLHVYGNRCINIKDAVFR